MDSDTALLAHLFYEEKKNDGLINGDTITER